MKGLNYSLAFILVDIMLALLCVSPSSAQMLSSPEPLRPSTDVWETIKYGDISPSLYTGTVNVNIPFYTYKDADFEIPISFSYASNGLQPNARAGSMGMGWRLNVGGCISREIKGVPDDEYGTVSFGNGNTITVRGFSYLSDSGLTPTYTYLYASGPLGPVDAQCYYTDATRSVYVDAEPDIFHFDFMGYTGSFMLDTDGYVHVFDTNVNPNSIKVEYDISFSTDKCAFAITTGDAYRYEFDGQIGNTGLNHEYSVIDGNPTMLAWHLSRIIAPNGRTVSFSYNRGPSVVSYRPNTTSYHINANIWTGQYEDRSSNAKQQYYTGVHSANLSSISIDGTPFASFTYTSTTEKRYSNISENNSDTVVGNNVLTGITISYANSTLRSCSMSYTYSNNPGWRRFLTSLSILGEGTYSMTYNAMSSVPMYGTFAIDHWDYYNSRYDADNSAFLNVSTLSADGMTETYNANNVREPSVVPSKYGILTRITYPTGGYSSFTYESHDYSKAQLRTPVYAFEPEVLPEAGIAGGVRIQSVENCSSEGTVLSKKTYTYKKNNASSGILLNKPRYRAVFHFSQNSMNTQSSSNTEETDKNVTFQNDSVLQRVGGYDGIAYLWSNNLTRYNSTHVEYSDVTETSLDGSTITYSYTTAEQYPDIVEVDEILYHKDPGDIPLYDIHWVSLDCPLQLFFLTSRQSLRGRVSGTVSKDSQGYQVASSSTSFLDLAPDDYTFVPVSSPADVELIGVYTGRDDIISHTSSQDFGSISVTSEEVRAYNSFFQLSQSTMTDSRGLKIRTKRQYVTDDLTGMNATVYNCGIIDAPISEKVYEVDANGNETLLSQTTWTYTRPAAAAHPNLVRVSSVAVKDVRENKTMNMSYLYDSYGHLLQKTDPDTSFKTYIWGYGGMYPVAEIKGATLSQVRSLSGLSGINTTPLPGSAAGYESALRAIPGVEVTTYEYTPMLGLTKVTGPDGRSESYTYNSSGKLRHVLDDLLERVSAHYYSADLESAAVNANN